MNKPHHCPKCGSENTAYRYIVWDSNNHKRVVGKCICDDCKAIFKEYYRTYYQGSEICEYDQLDGPLSAPVTFGTLEEPPDMGEDEESIVFRMADFAEKHKPLDNSMSTPVSNSSSKKSKVTLKRVPHRHVYEYYRTCCKSGSLLFMQLASGSP